MRTELSSTLQSPGGLLRAWRRHEGLTQADVASLLYVSAASVSAWETGTRGISREALQLLDEEYDAAGCLVDLVRAVGTPQGHQTVMDGRLVPRPHRRWQHVFTTGDGPVWIWIRPAAPGPVAGGLAAGAVGLRFGSRDASGPDGLFLAFDEWNSMCPVHVGLDSAGWVDFGRGPLPGWLQGRAHVVDAQANLELRGRDPREQSYLVEKLRRLDRADPDTFLERMRDLVGDELWARYTPLWDEDPGQGTAPPLAHDTGPRSQVVAEEQRDLHRRLRRARGLSRADAAAMVTGLVQPHARRVTEDQIYNYESGRRSRVRHLGALLDRVYDAGGWTCFEPVAVRRLEPGHVRVDLPSWWVGPVTLRVGQERGSRSGAGRPATVEGDVVRLATSRWQNERPLGPGRRAFAFCRVACDDLHVSVPPGRGVRAFLGHDPGATPIGRGWTPTEQYSDDAFTLYREALLALIGKTTTDFERALGRVAV